MQGFIMGGRKGKFRLLELLCKNMMVLQHQSIVYLMVGIVLN
jgi:hypothetical protein